MPDLLRVIARLNMGGPARHVIRITEPLRRDGWRTVLATGTTEDGEPDLIEEARDAGIDVRIIPGLGRSIRPTHDVRAAASLRQLVREVRPALVHTHTAKAGVLGRLAAGSVHPVPRRVHTFHGHVLSGYFGPWTSRAFAATEAFLARRTDKLIAVAAAVRDELVDVHGVGRREQYAIIPPGIDGARTAADEPAGRALRIELGVKPDEVLVGWIGRLEPVKDLPLALEVFHRLRKDGRRLRLLVVGDGSGSASAHAQLMATPGALYLPARAELGAVYGALDVLLQSSRREGLPQVIVEALEAGVPVVATAVGGIPELVRDGVDGVLAEPGDAAALAVALSQLTRSASRRDAMSRAARSRDRREMHAPAVAARLAAVYRSVMGQPALLVDVEADPVLETLADSGHAAPSCTSSS